MLLVFFVLCCVMVRMIAENNHAVGVSFAILVPHALQLTHHARGQRTSHAVCKEVICETERQIDIEENNQRVRGFLSTSTA